MGNEHSNIPGFEPLQPHEQFQASILLIDAPPAFHGFDLSERKWMLLRSIAVSIVRWDTRQTVGGLTTDQLRLVLNKHAGIVIFDQGLGMFRANVVSPARGGSGGGGGSNNIGTDAATTANAIKHLSNVLTQVTKGQAERTKFKLVPLRVSAAAAIFDTDLRNHADEYVNQFARRCNISQEVSNRLEWWQPASGDDVARFLISEVLSAESQTVPKDLQRPLKSLLTDLVESVDAREGHLFESSTLFPISSAGNDSKTDGHVSNNKLKQKAANLSAVLRKLSLPILSSTQSHVRYASFRVGVDTNVYMASVVPNTLFVVLVLKETSVAEGLIRLNCAHFAQHFTHVVTSFSKIDHRVEPLPLPIVGDELGSDSDVEGNY